MPRHIPFDLGSNSSIFKCFLCVQRSPVVPLIICPSQDAVMSSPRGNIIMGYNVRTHFLG